MSCPLLQVRVACCMNALQDPDGPDSSISGQEETSRQPISDHVVAGCGGAASGGVSGDGKPRIDDGNTEPGEEGRGGVVNLGSVGGCKSGRRKRTRDDPQLPLLHGDNEDGGFTPPGGVRSAASC